jgi:alpha-amylase
MQKFTCLLFLSILLVSCNLFSDQKINNTSMDTSFSEKEWILSTNVYEVNVRQFSNEGTFKAFGTEETLNRLRDLGVETLWFMPITPIAQKNKKGTLGSPYAAADYTSVNPELGTLEDFKQLVREAHGHGFKVIIDWVANHTGWDHKWTTEHPGWYLKDSATNDFLKASGLDDIIELDFKNKAMRKAMIDAMKYWVQETGIDGFRCDLASWVEVDFWQEAKPEVEKIKPLFWLGELDPIENPEYMQVFDAA